MERTVLGLTEPDHLVEVDGRGRRNRLIRDLVRRTGFVLARPQNQDMAQIEDGRLWPKHALTMIGRKRLDNIRSCLEQAIADDIPGDYLEAGTWRGGASLFAKAVLAANGDTDRVVWLADSFAGLPPATLAQDAEFDYFSKQDILTAPYARVRAAFEWHGLLDDRVRFLQGWFKDTLGSDEIGDLAVLRCDGDLYESTMDTLRPLYPKLQPGGFCIVDDYGIVEACKVAVDEYRAEHGITDELVDIDGWGWFWRKSG
jgi:O-methyltransferase